MQGPGRYFALVVALAGAVAVGCNTGPDGLGHNSPITQEFDPLVFPWEGQLGYAGFGSTAAILIDSNYIVTPDVLEQFNLHADRVTIKIADADVGDAIYWPTPIEVNLRSVLDLEPSQSSVIADIKPGFAFTAAIFDLPSVAQLSPLGPPAPGDYPAMALIEVYIDGAATPLHTSRFRITGGSGEPNALADPAILGQATLQEDLELRRMIRIRGKRGANQFSGMFYPGQPPIGAIEFDLQYLTICLKNPRVYPTAEASKAMVLISPPVPLTYPYEVVHVAMVDPKGMEIRFNQSLSPYVTADPTLAGAGPFLDFAFDDVPIYGCTIGSPTVWSMTNLLVTDLEGSVVIENTGPVVLDNTASPDTNAVFRIYPVDVNGS